MNTPHDTHGGSQAARVPVPSTTTGERTGRGSRMRSLVYPVLGRVGYWSPVIAVVVLFAQVAFRGMRPSMAEARRLAAAEVTLVDRHQRAVDENSALAAQLLARQDPIFRERQRRLRVIEPAAVPEIARSGDK